MGQAELGKGGSKEYRFCAATVDGRRPGREEVKPDRRTQLPRNCTRWCNRCRGFGKEATDYRPDGIMGGLALELDIAAAMTQTLGRKAAAGRVHEPVRPDGWRLKLYAIIFESDTPAGMWFDRLLIALILASVAVVLVDSVRGMHEQAGEWLWGLEWLFTGIFTVEYVARLLCVRHPLRYATSFFGIVDLLAILPSYLALIIPETQALIDIRILRLLRIFRILRLVRFVEEYQHLGMALKTSARKILVFLSVVLMAVLVLGTLLYVIEGPENGFTSIPVSVYWAITTVTTVGFGDITPKTDLGRLVASAVMLLGWGTLAVPTGIVTSEFTAQRLRENEPATRTCRECLSEGHGPDSRYCRDCGARLPEEAGEQEREREPLRR